MQWAVPLMPEHFVERRRLPRTVIADTDLSVMAFPVPVRLLDISLGGVLFEAANPVELGTRATLRLNFGGSPFSVAVKVERLQAPRNAISGSYLVGASFIALNRDDRRVIERFARQ